MNLFKTAVIGALVALVAGTAILVYGYHDQPLAKENDPLVSERLAADRLAQNEQIQPKSSTPLPTPPSAPLPDPDDVKMQQSAPGEQPLFDLESLPKRVKENLGKIVAAAQSGDLEAMRPVLESNGIKPMVRNGPSTDPIAYWKKQSVDGTGRDILAAILNVFSSGFVKTGEKDNTMYVWPYFAKRDLTKLTPVEQVELFRIVPPKQAVKMMQSGKYTGYRAGISERGILHYFKK